MRSIKSEYVEIRADQLPEKVYWTTPERFQGNIQIVSFGSTVRDRGGYDDGDPYMKIYDQSDRTTSYFRLAK